MLESQKELFKKSGVDLVTVNIDQDRFMTGLENFLNREGYTFRIIVNHDTVAAGGPDIDVLYDVNGRTPFSYLIAKGGEVRDVHWGAVDEAGLAEILKKAE